MNTPSLTRYFNGFRLSSYLLVLFCAGHSRGALLSTPHFGPEADAVLSSMKSVHFVAQHANDTWFGFYLGFGWLVSVFFLFSAVVTWHLGGLQSADERRAMAAIIWALFLSYAASSYLSWTYFFIAPGVFSTAVAAILGFECLKMWPAHQAAITRERRLASERRAM
jgi:hypothetical protein